MKKVKNTGSKVNLSFNYRNKSIKNLVFSVLLAGLIFSFFPIVIDTLKNLKKIFTPKETPDPDLIKSQAIEALIPMAVIFVLILILGIIKFIYDINMARYAEKSKAFNTPMVSKLTFAITPSVGGAGLIAGGALLGVIVFNMITIALTYIGQEGADVGAMLTPWVKMGRVASPAICCTTGIILVWNIVLNIINIVKCKNKK